MFRKFSPFLLSTFSIYKQKANDSTQTCQRDLVCQVRSGKLESNWMQLQEFGAISGGAFALFGKLVCDANFTQWFSCTFLHRSVLSHSAQCTMRGAFLYLCTSVLQYVGTFSYSQYTRKSTAFGRLFCSARQALAYWFWIKIIVSVSR